MATTYSNNAGPNTPRNRGDYEAAHMTSVTPGEDVRSVMINRVVWGPVFAGVAMAMAVQFILNLVGIGLGVASLVPDTTSNWAVANLSIGTAIWWTVSGIIAAYCGGYTAGRLSGDPVESSAGWHGLVSWAASVLILSGLVAAGAGVFMGGMLNTTGFTSAYSLRGQPAATQPPNIPANTSAVTPDNAAEATEAMVPPPAGNTVNGVQVPVATSSTMDSATLSRLIMQGSLLSALALVFAGLAAWFGGRAGTIKPTITTVARGKLH